MHQKSFFYPFVFIMYALGINVACSNIAAPTPTQTPVIDAPPQPANHGSSDLKTFTDQNNLYQVDVPADWTHNQRTGENYYLDILLSPGETVKVENIVYNNGKAFTGSQNGRFALDLLNKFYSETGREGDIRVTDDSIMDDGSERLTWTSRSGGYSGVSFFEVRGNDRKTFLMFTVYWLDSVENQCQDIVNNIVRSYHIP